MVCATGVLLGAVALCIFTIAYMPFGVLADM